MSSHVGLRGHIAMTESVTQDESSMSVASEPVVTPIMEPKPRHTYDLVNDPAQSMEQSKWVKWYLGAPGTVLGTVVGIVVVLVLEQIPALHEFANANLEFADQIHFIGRIYFRALTCVTIPLAFLNVTMCISDLVASQMRRKVLLVALTLFTTTCALAQGLFWCHFFASSFDGHAYLGGLPEADVTIQCPSRSSGNAPPALLQHDPSTGALSCVQSNFEGGYANFSTTSLPFEPNFPETYVKWFPSSIAEILNLINLVVPDNMTTMVMDNNVLGVVTFSLLFGVACGVRSRQDKDNRLVDILRELHAIFKTMLSYVVAVTPVAIIALIAAPLLAHTHTLAVDGPRLAAFLGTFVLAAIIHCFVVLPLILIVSTRTNPFRFFGLMKDALIYGFSCSSSRKSTPVASRSMDSLEGNRNVARFATSIGTCINKSGGALYVCMALIWTFRNAGLGSLLTYSKLGVVGVLSVIGSLAIPPVRTGGVAIVVTFFTYLSGVPITYSYSFLLVAECILDPLTTVINLWGNLLVARIASFNSV
ncbi:hypothetical protein H257_18797 [Aphanomyces astaci]|uniref:Amino acid transporter n=2 Tax=Aphanomyces astaci TaxID=112090 RepID=W4FA09_APHAT|nr:hypothetical protein H257_18797 [Aphanomyces astaci]ETV64297.1 hypothetical protein H257_18797 [Aphanomyces astaci]RQM21325.1 hypothetical protein B5M09_009903 [Aphanomyces astaci]|eukprot:XP_009846225.1 hypothetical protein H257_18797 [Aphanomyces astaci]